MPPAQLWQVGQFLDADDAVVERGLQALGHGIGQDHCNHDWQNVRDLARQLEDDDCCGDRVCDSTREGSCTWWKGGEVATQGQDLSGHPHFSSKAGKPSFGKQGVENRSILPS